MFIFLYPELLNHENREDEPFPLDHTEFAMGYIGG